MTEKQRNKVFEIVQTLSAALDMGYKVMDDKDREVLGFRYNAKVNPNTWCYLLDGKTGHMVHAAIKYKPKNRMLYSATFYVHKPGKKPVVVR